MNVTVRPIEARLKGPVCQRPDCPTTAENRVLDADTGSCLVVYCRKHTDELTAFLARNAS